MSAHELLTTQTILIVKFKGLAVPSSGWEIKHEIHIYDKVWQKYHYWTSNWLEYFIGYSEQTVGKISCSLSTYLVLD